MTSHRREQRRGGATGLEPRQRGVAPASRQRARAILKAESFKAPRVELIRLEALEFTSLCPVSGQPDFGRVVIEYVPRSRCVESRSLKSYLWFYRGVGAFCETLASDIADDIVFAISPRRLHVEVHQNVRGGITIVATATR